MARTRKSRKKDFPQRLVGIVVLEIIGIAGILNLAQWAQRERLGSDDARAVSSEVLFEAPSQAESAERTASTGIPASEKRAWEPIPVSVSSAEIVKNDSPPQLATAFPARQSSVDRTKVQRPVYPYPEPALTASTDARFSVPQNAPVRYNDR
jgi:hypothetical protein